VKKHILRRNKEWTYDDTRKVGIEDTFLFIVFPMNLQKMRAKIVDNSFIIVGTVTEGCNAEWDSSQVGGKVKLERWTDYLETRTPLASFVCKISVLSVDC
jgi:hypothetical protein